MEEARRPAQRRIEGPDHRALGGAAGGRRPGHHGRPRAGQREGKRSGSRCSVSTAMATRARPGPGACSTIVRSDVPGPVTTSRRAASAGWGRGRPACCSPGGIRATRSCSPTARCISPLVAGPCSVTPSSTEPLRTSSARSRESVGAARRTSTFGWARQKRPTISASGSAASVGSDARSRRPATSPVTAATASAAASRSRGPGGRGRRARCPQP